jgi:hypothetical protein
MSMAEQTKTTTVDLPRVSKGVRSEFTVTLNDVSVLSDVYVLGKTWAFSLTIAATGQKFVSNVEQTDISRERMESLRQKVKTLMNSKPLEGFEDLYPIAPKEEPES